MCSYVRTASHAFGLLVGFFYTMFFNSLGAQIYPRLPLSLDKAYGVSF